MLLRRFTQHVKDQNWFAAALDFVIVVIGVGVALMGQQWLADRQQKADLAKAEIILSNDLFTNYFIAKERLAIRTCRLTAYRELGDRLLQPGGPWTGLPREKTDSVIQLAFDTVLRSPSRSWGSDTWASELARGTFNKMPDERRQMLTSLFIQSAKAERLQDDIYTLQSRLKALAVSVPDLGQSDRLKYFDILAELDDKSALLELISQQNITFIDAMGIGFDEDARSQASEAFASANENSRRVYGDCFEPMTHPALDAPEAEPKAP